MCLLHSEGIDPFTNAIVERKTYRASLRVFRVKLFNPATPANSNTYALRQTEALNDTPINAVCAVL